MNQQVKTVEKEEKFIEYLPFGNKDMIKLSLSIVKSYIATPTKQGKLPTDKDIMNFIMLCKSRELNPFEGDAFLIGFDTQDGPKFNLITAHQAFLKRAVADDNYDGMESGIVVKDENGVILDRQSDFIYPGDTLLGGWARVHDKTKSVPILRRLNLEPYNKGLAQWKTNPAMMIVKCAEADALRSAYPNRVGGMYLREEMDSQYSDSFKPIEMPKMIEPDQNVPEVKTEPQKTGENNSSDTWDTPDNFAVEMEMTKKAFQNKFEVLSTKKGFKDWRQFLEFFGVPDATALTCAPSVVFKMNEFIQKTT